LTRPRQPAEQCELCSAGVGAGHLHVIEPTTRRLLCCCEACSILFSGGQQTRYRTVPRDVYALPDLRLSDAQWESLLIPINVAFFYPSSVAGRVVALYPSPAGATESLLALETWAALVRENPVLGELQADVEALLVYRLGSSRVYYRAPIDDCFRLVGLFRARWRGLSGGREVWDEIAAFFADLQARAIVRPASRVERAHA
jgi:hypothetical protein